MLCRMCPTWSDLISVPSIPLKRQMELRTTKVYPDHAIGARRNGR